MLRTNVLDAAKESVVAHGGRGRIGVLRPYAATDFESDLTFIDYAELPPGTSIGVHRHGDDEEVYFVVAGTGTMTTNGERYRVRAGDVIVNRRGWSHGLENDSPTTLRIFVFEVGCRARRRASAPRRAGRQRKRSNSARRTRRAAAPAVPGV